MQENSKEDKVEFYVKLQLCKNGSPLINFLDF